MPIQNAIDLLRDLHLLAMADALTQQDANPTIHALGFEERLSIIIEAEYQAREVRKHGRLVRAAKLKMDAHFEEFNYASKRGIDRELLNSLLSCDWIQRSQNILLTGPTGIGKSWLACAFANQAMRKGISAIYKKTSRLLEEFEVAHADGSVAQLRSSIARTRLLILDDWGLFALSTRGRQDLLEVVDDRVGVSSTIITSQLPVEKWYAYIDEPTLADAILDRLVHTAHRIDLHGESLRKMRSSKVKS